MMALKKLRGKLCLAGDFNRRVGKHIVYIQRKNSKFWRERNK